MDGQDQKMQVMEVIGKTKVKMKSYKIADMRKAERDFDLVQPKYDGWFALCFYDGPKGNMRIFSSGGVLVKDWEMERTSFTATFLGELMHGTNWSQHPSRKGNLYLHDVIEVNEDVRYTIDDYTPYFQRKSMLDKLAPRMHDDRISVVETYTSSEAPNVWGAFVLVDGFEGLVFKNSNSYIGASAGRIKRVFTEDYICMGVVEGSGRLEGTMGAIIGALHIDGKLRKVISVGGGFDDSQRRNIWANRDRWMGRVFQAHGNQKFESGGLRHPAFDRWRPDKLPENCVLS